MAIPGPATDRRWNHAALAVSALAFVLYGVHRQRWVGGCDQTAYLFQALRFLGVDSGWAPDRTIALAAPMAPQCTAVHHGVLQAFFLPGFPALLALAGVLGLEFHVTPFLGAASGLALYYLVRERSLPVIALGTMIAWLVSPLVVWSSTQLMSDGPATALPLFALLAVRRGLPATAGVVLGVCLAIRPTTLLLVPWFVLECPGRQAVLRGVGGAAVAGVGWALLIQLRLGGFPPPYIGNIRWLERSGWGQHTWFLLETTVSLYLPVVALAAVGFALQRRVVTPLVASLGLFAMFYGLWAHELHAWWEPRFLLPALPALFLAAAAGANALRQRVPWVRWGPWGGLVVLGYASWSLMLSPARAYIWTGLDANVSYAIDARRVARAVPEHALIGAISSSGPLRLYEHLESFDWCHPEAARLIAWASRTGRPVYALLAEDEMRCDPLGTELELQVFENEPSGRVLYHVASPRGRLTIDVGTADARRFLLGGWSGDEGVRDASYVWAVGQHATLAWPEGEERGNTLVSFVLWPFAPGGSAQTMAVSTGGVQLGRFVLENRPQGVDVRIPARLAGQIIELQFSSAVAPASLGGSEDRRLLAAAFDRVTFRAVR